MLEGTHQHQEVFSLTITADMNLANRLGAVTYPFIVQMTHGMSFFPSVTLNILEPYLFPSVASEENSTLALLVLPFFPE
jgi:hypothetical protein